MSFHHKTIKSYIYLQPKVAIKTNAGLRQRVSSDGKTYFYVEGLIDESLCNESRSNGSRQFNHVFRVGTSRWDVSFAFYCIFIHSSIQFPWFKKTNKNKHCAVHNLFAIFKHSLFH